MTHKKLQYIQLALEASIPLMGYFLWEWSLYFILLFYFLDLFSSELIMHLKGRQIFNYNRIAINKKQWAQGGVLSALVLALSVITIHVTMLQIHPEMIFLNEIVDFWQYEEMGIQQGYLFVPLVLLMSWQQYKLEFIMPARYRTTTMKNLWRPHIISGITVLIGAILSLVTASLVAINELYFILIIVVVIVLFKLLYKH